MTGAITFDSISLQTYIPTTQVGIITNSIEHTNIPDKDVALLALANANGSAIPFVAFPNKKVSIAGVIVGSSSSDLDTRIDAFKSLFGYKDKNLDISYGASTRRYIATSNAVSVKRQQKALFAEFGIEFVCSLPFGRNTTLTTALNASGRTASGYTDAHTFLGSAPIQQPIITITYSAITGGANYVQFVNNANGQSILITDQTWIASDVLEIDTRTGYRTVKKNGVEVDFLGAFPEFVPGAGSFSYSDGFTTRTLTELVTYYPEYL